MLIYDMGMRCLFGHDSSSAVWNKGLAFGSCTRCGCILIRTAATRWYPIPKGYVVIWAVTGAHAGTSKRLITIAKNHAPLIHRMRRRKQTYGHYFQR